MRYSLIILFCFLFSRATYSQEYDFIKARNQMRDTMRTLKKMTFGELFWLYKDSIAYIEQIGLIASNYHLQINIGLKSDSSVYIMYSIRYTQEELEEKLAGKWLGDVYPLERLLYRRPEELKIYDEEYFKAYEKHQKTLPPPRFR